MDNQTIEIFKQMLTSVLRGGFLALGSLHVRHGILNAADADLWVSGVSYAVAGAVVVAIPLVWKYFNAKYNILVLRAAVQTTPPADTTAEVSAAVANVKAEVSAAPTTTISY